jgi:hypothetical protein
MSVSAREIIHREFESALSGLVECYSGEIPQVTTANLTAIDEVMASVVGFGDLQFRGSAILLAHEDVAKVLAHSTPRNTADWLGELGNQLVGRLKNKLAAYGVLPQLGAPVTICGHHLGFSSMGANTASWRVEWPQGTLQAMLSLHLDDDLQLVLDTSSATAEEGSLSLF